MKNKFLKCCFVMSILVAFLLLVGCIQNPADKENDLGKTYKVDFSALSSWSDADTFKFDKATGRLTVSEIYTGGSVWLSSFDASDYNYLEIKYSQARGSFLVSVRYADETISTMGCAEYENTAYVSLDLEKKSKISSISIEAMTPYASAVIESLTFT